MLPPEIEWLIVMFTWAEYDLQKFNPIRPADFSLKKEVDWVCNNVGKVPDAFLRPQVKTVGGWEVPNPLRVFYPFYPPCLLRWPSVFQGGDEFGGWTVCVQRSLFVATHTYRAVFRRNLNRQAGLMRCNRQGFVSGWNALMTKYFFNSEWGELKHYERLCRNETTRRIANDFKLAGWLEPY